MSKVDVDMAENLACRLRGKLGMGMSVPVNIKTVLRQLNIQVVYRPLSDKLCGLSLKSKDGEDKFMLVNCRSTRGRQHFTVAHELYHLIYDEDPAPHFCEFGSGRNATEMSADKFASAFLMPREGILEGIPANEIKSRRVSLETAIRLGQLYGVSHHTLVLRLKDLNVITQQCTDDLLSVSIKHEAHLRGTDVSLYESGNEGLLISDFGMLARALYDKERISEGHYGELLNVIGYGEGEDCSGC